MAAQASYPSAVALMAGKARHTSEEMPVMISFLRPVARIAALTLGSSQAFTVERSMISRSGGEYLGQLGNDRSPHAASSGGGYHQRQPQHLSGSSARCIRPPAHDPGET